MNSEILTQLSPEMVQKVKSYLDNSSLFNLNLTCKDVNYVGVSEKERKLRDCNLYPLSEDKVNNFSCGHLFCTQSIVQYLSTNMDIDSIRKNHGDSLLEKASFTNNLDSVKYLVELFNLSNPEYRRDIEHCGTLLIKLVMRGQSNTLKYLICSLKITKYHILYSDIFMTSCTHNKINLVRFLVDYIEDKYNDDDIVDDNGIDSLLDEEVNCLGDPDDLDYIDDYEFENGYSRDMITESFFYSVTEHSPNVVVFLRKHFQITKEEVNFNYILTDLTEMDDLLMLKYMMYSFRPEKDDVDIENWLSTHTKFRTTYCYKFLSEYEQ